MRKTIQAVCGLSVVVAFVFSTLFALSFVNRLMIWRVRDQYKPESFIVTGAEYHADAGVPDGGGDVTYWLDGIVAGTPERLIPNRNGTPQPRNADDLERRYPKGTKINVLYNPTAERTIVQDETLRVKVAVPDFWDREARLRLKLGIFVFVPAPLTFCIYLIVRHINWRHDPNSVSPLIVLRNKPRVS